MDQMNQEYNNWINATPNPIGQISQISKNIYISDWTGSLDVNQLDRLGIRAVLCLNDRFKTEDDLFNYIDRGISHKHITIYDDVDVNIMKHFPEIYKYMYENIRKGGVLVHCTAGISRSVTAVASFMIRHGLRKNKSLNIPIVLKYIKQKRNCANPNPSFIRQLQIYESMIKLR